MKPRALVAPLAVGLLLRIAWIVVASHSALPVDDVDGYLPMAERLAAHQPLVTALRDGVGVLRPPLYPLLLSLPLRAHVAMTPVLVAQAGLAAAAIVAVAWLCALTAGPRAGTAGAWIAACWPAWWSSAATLATEHLDLPLVTAGLALVVVACRRRDGTSPIASGVCFGVASLVRSTSLYVAPLLALVASRRLGRRAALIPIVIVIVTAPYIAFISRDVGRLVVVENLLEWNWRLTQEGRLARDTGDAAFSDVSRVIAGEYRAHAVEQARSAAGRMKMMLFSTWSWEYSTDEQVPPWMSRAAHAAAAVSVGVLYVFAAIGIARIRDRDAVVLLAAWTLLHIAADIIGPGIEARHRAPFEPALMALASGGAASVILTRCRSRNSSSMPISSAV